MTLRADCEEERLDKVFREGVPSHTSHCRDLENTLEMKNPKKEKMTDEQHQPVSEEMPVSTTIGVIGYVGQHSAGV